MEAPSDRRPVDVKKRQRRSDGVSDLGCLDITIEDANNFGQTVTLRYRLLENWYGSGIGLLG